MEYFWQVHLSLNSQTIRSSQIARITEWLKQFEILEDEKKKKKKKEPVELVSPLFVNRPLKPGFLKSFTILVGRCPIIYWRSVQKELQKEWRRGTSAKTIRRCGWDWWQKQGLMLQRTILHRNVKCQVHEWRQIGSR